ncbi:MAG: hypothetical protein WA943_01970 [Parvibaculum sp.]|uniref:hypothetical protein n=1 Tax=Parvibaculum sp. TaxID=2024848 RepID=UPI003C71E051
MNIVVAFQYGNPVELVAGFLAMLLPYRAAWQGARIGVAFAQPWPMPEKDRDDDAYVPHQRRLVDHLTGGPDMSHIDLPVWPPLLEAAFLFSRSERRLP